MPIPEASVISLLSDISLIEGQIRDRLEKARQLRSRLFGIEDADKVHQELQNLRNEAQVLSTSLVQSDDLDFQIRNFYPYPLAYAYRTTSALHDAAELYQEYLRVAENGLAFLGCLGLAITDYLQLLQRPENTKLTSMQLSEMWRGGISPGDWQSMLQESARLLKELRSAQSSISSNDQKGFLFASQFASIWYRGRKESPLADLFRALVKIKNDFKHDRGPRTTVAYQEHLPTLQEHLKDVYQAVAFLIQYPIQLVQRADMHWRTRKMILDTLVYQGDHPGLRRERHEFDAPIPSNKLYLALTPNSWVPLYPFISVQYCPRCQSNETYFIDRYDGSRGTIRLKSFERGHPIEDNDIAREVAVDLEAWLTTISRTS